MSLINASIFKILFFDIETVSQYSDYFSLPEKIKILWDEKSQKIDKRKKSEDLYERAPLYAEFGKIICISVGFIYEKENQRFIRIKSFYGDDEKEILTNFFELLNNNYTSNNNFLCGHNIKEFDIPFIIRRAIINRIQIPDILNVVNYKPWETRFLDTMDIWRFGEYKNYISLNLLAGIFDIPSPKDEISGKDVHDVYYKEKNINKIVNYCQKDVITLIKIYLRYENEGDISDNNIEFV